MSSMPSLADSSGPSANASDLFSRFHQLQEAVTSVAESSVHCYGTRMAQIVKEQFERLGSITMVDQEVFWTIRRYVHLQEILVTRVILKDIERQTSLLKCFSEQVEPTEFKHNAKALIGIANAFIKRITELKDYLKGATNSTNALCIKKITALVNRQIFLANLVIDTEKSLLYLISLKESLSTTTFDSKNIRPLTEAVLKNLLEYTSLELEELKLSSQNRYLSGLVNLAINFQDSSVNTTNKFSRAEAIARGFSDPSLKAHALCRVAHLHLGNGHLDTAIAILASVEDKNRNEEILCILVKILEEHIQAIRIKKEKANPHLLSLIYQLYRSVQIPDDDVTETLCMEFNELKDITKVERLIELIEDPARKDDLAERFRVSPVQVPTTEPTRELSMGNLNALLGGNTK